MSSKSLKNHLLAFVAVGAFMVAQPNFAQSESLISGFYLQLEGRYVMSDGDETPYAVSRTRQIFEIGMNEEDTTARFGMGIHIGNRLDIGLHYSGLNIQGSRGGQVCGGLPTSGAVAITLACVAPLIGNPVPGFAYYGAPAHNLETTTYDTTYHVVDFEVGYSLKLGQVDVRAFAGVRYADFDQSINASGNLLTSMANFGLGTIILPGGIHADFKRDVLTQGIGPRLGAEANVPLGSGTGFGLAGSVSGSVLFGDRDTFDTGTFAGLPGFSSGARTLIADGDNGETFWNAEGDLGVTYGVELGNASSMIMTIGYRVEAWFNVNNTRNSFVSSGALGFPAGKVFGDVEADQVFHGPFLRAKLNF